MGIKKNPENYIYLTLGKAIRKARIKAGLSQERASYFVDVSINTYIGAEKGYRWVSKAKYKQICEFFKLPYEELLLKDIMREANKKDER